MQMEKLKCTYESMFVKLDQFKKLTIKPENHIQRIRFRYDIFPKSSGEIDTLDIPHDKEKLKSLLKG